MFVLKFLHTHTNPLDAKALGQDSTPIAPGGICYLFFSSEATL